MRAIREQAQKLVSSYVVKTPSLDTPVRSLSGGNIQKMIMAREMSAAAPVLVVSQPTRGVDIGAAEYIHARLVDARAAGVGDSADLRGARRSPGAERSHRRDVRGPPRGDARTQ